MFNNALNILKTINEAGFECYIIGGYPRNKYLNLNSDDIDICTNATFVDIKNIYDNVKYINYGSMILTNNNFNYDITTFRIELDYDNRHPKYKYTNNILEDIKRRDFTINALCIDKNGNYIDFIDSKSDLDNKIIKIIGNHNIKLKEDPFRILRAIRIATELNFKIDSTLKEKIKEYGYLLNSLSFARKKDELDKIFKSENNIYGLNLIKELNLDNHLNISINKVKETSYIGIWYQVIKNTLYPFTKKEKGKLKRLNNLINSSFSNYDLYISDLDTIKIASEISNNNLIEKYNILPIRSFNDINIEISQLLKFSKNITDIKKDIEIKIVNNNLENTTEVIIKYLNSKYKL